MHVLLEALTLRHHALSLVSAASRQLILSDVLGQHSYARELKVNDILGQYIEICSGVSSAVAIVFAYPRLKLLVDRLATRVTNPQSRHEIAANLLGQPFLSDEKLPNDRNNVISCQRLSNAVTGEMKFCFNLSITALQEGASVRFRHARNRLYMS